METVGEGGRWESGVWLTGNVELGVIRVAVKVNVVFPEYVTEWEKIDDEEQGAEDRTLRNTGSDRKGARGESWTNWVRSER